MPGAVPVSRRGSAEDEATIRETVLMGGELEPEFTAAATLLPVAAPTLATHARKRSQEMALPPLVAAANAVGDADKQQDAEQAGAELASVVGDSDESGAVEGNTGDANAAAGSGPRQGGAAADGGDGGGPEVARAAGDSGYITVLDAKLALQALQVRLKIAALFLFCFIL
jgi:hypothetical protein